MTGFTFGTAATSIPVLQRQTSTDDSPSRTQPSIPVPLQRLVHPPSLVVAYYLSIRKLVAVDVDIPWLLVYSFFYPVHKDVMIVSSFLVLLWLFPFVCWWLLLFRSN